MTQALTAYGDGRVELIDMVAPTKTIDEILIRPLFSGVCGKDLEIIRGDIDPSSISNPIVLGHEWCGEVIATSPARPDIHKWDQVVVQGIIPCESCVECSSGNTNRCLTYDEFGFTRNGAIAPYLVAPAKLVHKINSTITPSVAALVEPMAVVLTGFMKADIGLSPSILIIGDGTIGLL
jgi:threonine dehydrogenase-like Zn-dependent dehydrogenase